MPRLPKIPAFLLRFFLFYFAFVLLANLSGFRDGFRYWFAKKGTAMYEAFIPNAKTSFESADDLGEHDMRIVFINQKTYQQRVEKARQAGLQNVNIDASATPFSTWDYFLLPFILLISLTLALPASWRRKGWSFLLGGFLLFLFTWFRFRCTLFYMAGHSKELEDLGLSEFSRSFLNGINRMQSIEFIFISTFIIWAIASIRKEDLQVFTGNK